MNPPQPPSPSGPPASRFVAIWVPDWPVVALTLEARQQRRPSRARQEAPHLPDPATEPVAVVGARGVLAASAPARRAGITTGMRLRAARSLCPELTVLPPQEESQARAFETVMEALTLHALGVRVAGMSVVSDLSFADAPTDPTAVIEAASAARQTVVAGIEAALTA